VKLLVTVVLRRDILAMSLARHFLFFFRAICSLSIYNINPAHTYPKRELGLYYTNGVKVFKGADKKMVHSSIFILIGSTNSALIVLTMFKKSM
jgi:hypothetical protein